MLIKILVVEYPTDCSIVHNKKEKAVANNTLLGKEIPLIALINTGIRLPLIVKSLGVSKEAVITFSKKISRYDPKMFPKGMYITPDGIMKNRHKSYMIHLFYLIYVEVKQYIEKNFSSLEQKNLQSLIFAVAFSFFDEIYQTITKKTLTTRSQLSQISASHLFLSLIFIKTGLIQICVCLHQKEKLIGNYSRSPCDCEEILSRNKRYWDFLRKEIKETEERIKQRQQISDEEIRARLEKVILDASLQVMHINQNKQPS